MQNSFLSCHYWEVSQEKRQLVLSAPNSSLLMTRIDFGRFDTEKEALAIANAADVGLAGGCLSWLGQWCHF